MKKLLLFLIIVFIAFAGDAQNFFEKIIPNEDGIMRQGQYVVETQDHGFIVACTAPYYYQNDLLLSVDEDGEITNSLVMQIGEKILKYCGVFKHPDYNDEYLAIAVLTNDSYNYIQNSIIFLRVDDKLNILNQDVWQLDEEYTQLAGWQCTDFPKFIVNDDGTLEMAAHFYRYDTHYGYLFAKLTPDGEPIKMQEDYEVKNNGNLLLDFFIKSKTDHSYGVIRWYQTENQGSGNWCFYLDSTYNCTKKKRITSLSLREVPENVSIPDSVYLLTPGIQSSAEYYNDSLFLLTSKGTYWTNSGNMGEINTVAIVNDSLDVYDVKFWDIIRNSKSISAEKKAISVAGNSIYHCGINNLRFDHMMKSLQNETTIVISKFDKDLKLIWRRYYDSPGQSYDIQSIKATEDGGCIIVGVNASIETWDAPNIYILKVDENGYDAVGENAESVAKPYFCYPNPAKDNIYIEFSPDVNSQSVEIYTLDGRLVETFPETSQQTTINVENLNAGVYILKLRMADGKEFAERIVKE